MGQLKTKFLQSYFLGEGLSGFIPALIGTVQGIGKTTCLENGTAIYGEPRFDVGVFWLVMSVIMFISLSAFFILNFSFQKYFVEYSITSETTELSSSDSIAG
jgi:riboflavin transporter 2